MLEKFGGGGNNNEAVKDSALARQSLYVKFDPLVKGPNSPAIQKGRARAPQVQSVTESDDLLLMSTPPANRQKPRHPAARVLENQVEELGEDGARTMDQLLMCSPATRRNGADSGRPESSSPRSPTHTDAPHTSSKDSADIVQVLKYSQGDVNRMRKEWELDFKSRFLSKERDWMKKYEVQDGDLKSCQEQMETLSKTSEEMKTIVTEYERTITQLIGEKELTSTDSKDLVETLIKEKDQALEDLQSVETAFSDLHKRYEKTKGVLDGFKKNEEMLKKCMADYQNKLRKQEEKYQALKRQAEEKLEVANEEIGKVRKSTESEMAGLRLALKKAELHTNNLEQTVDQKTKENTELTAICDELISKVGH